MVTAVFDTNVLVSALIRAGMPRELWNKVLEGKIQLIVSRELLLEFDDVTSRRQFRRYISRKGVAKFRKILLQNARVTRIKSQIDLIMEDSDDNAVLEAAYDGMSDYVVSGDSHLLELKSYEGIKIVNVKEMLDILSQAY